LDRLLADAIAYATGGFTTSWSQSRYGREKSAELLQMPGFADAFMPGGTPPAPLSICKNEALARTFATMAKEGLRAFYDGSIARLHAGYLGRIDSPLRIADFESTAPREVEPIDVGLTTGRLYNMPPPTQGTLSLLILALFERLAVVEPEGFAHVHGIVEATKQAFILRNAYLGDPDFMPCRSARWLDFDTIAKLRSSIDMHKALRWPHASEVGDTVWMGAADRFGTIVSFIQSIYWEFGSGVVCPDTGVVFQNRGSSFTLAPGPNQLMPGRRPFHTLNPALAHLNDGRWMAYGTMGGEGQPQTQAAVYSRYAMFGRPLQAAITAPRWLLGRTWGDQSTTLKLERRFPETLFADLSAAGHAVQWVDDFSDAVGHAGGVVMHPSGVFEAAADPRSDGTAVAL
jgi:gamma-glutamyltranspeptidase/glutathione hydrolase